MLHRANATAKPKQTRRSQRTRLLTMRSSEYIWAVVGWVEGFIMKTCLYQSIT
jgi:hypothetical protein